ncbi:MAG: putative porin [Phycisphaerae bacterium]|nr:putative porin [Phycisphaerae bacterium]
MRRQLGVWGGIVLVALSFSTRAMAQGKSSDADTAAKLEALTRQLEEQRRELQQLRAQVTSRPDGHYMTDGEREALARMIREEMAKVDSLKAGIPKWLDGLKFTGDIRVRYEGQFFNGHTAGKTTPWDYNRGRFRVRFGFAKDFTDEWSGGFMLATGNTSDPWETNQTMTGDFTRKPIQVDQAWIQYKPKYLNKEVTVVAGKFANPFVTTEMLWDADIRPEGAAETWNHKFSEDFSTFMTAGQFILQDNANADMVALLAYQLGIRYKISPRTALTLAAAYYQYVNVDEDTQLASFKKGNSVETGALHGVGGTHFSSIGKQDFQILDLYSDITFMIGEKAKQRPLKFFGQVDWNLDNSAPSPWSDEKLAFIAGASFGQIKKKGDWEVSYNYRWVEANAIVAAFSESAFGGTNRQGHNVGFKYALADNVTAGVKYFFYDWIVPTGEPSRNMVRAEVEVKF